MHVVLMLLITIAVMASIPTQRTVAIRRPPIDWAVRVASLNETRFNVIFGAYYSLAFSLTHVVVMKPPAGAVPDGKVCILYFGGEMPSAFINRFFNEVACRLHTTGNCGVHDSSFARWGVVPGYL